MSFKPNNAITLVKEAQLIHAVARHNKLVLVTNPDDLDDAVLAHMVAKWLDDAAQGLRCLEGGASGEYLRDIATDPPDTGEEG